MRTVYFDIDDRTRELKEEVARDRSIGLQFQEKFEISWIYHENALEGIVLDVFDLKAALEHATLEDGVLIPVYQRIRNHKNAIEKVKKVATPSARVPTLSFIKDLHVTLSYGLGEQQGGVYRKEIPIHRSYYHEILAPNRISYQMNKLVRDLKSKEFKQYHPIRQASEIHYRLMKIFPFDEITGKVARLCMNFFAMRAGYPPIIIPSMERQHYYDALRVGSQDLHDLIVRCVEQTIEMSLRYFREGSQDLF